MPVIDGVGQEIAVGDIVVFPTTSSKGCRTVYEGLSTKREIVAIVKWGQTFKVTLKRVEEDFDQKTQDKLAYNLIKIFDQN